MPEKKEAKVLIIAIVMTLGFIGACIWGLTQIQGFSKTSSSSSSQDSPPDSQQTDQTLAQISNVPAGLFSYGGSTTWVPIRQVADPAIQTVWPQFKLRYTQHPTKPPGSTAGIEMLLNNQLAFAQSSRPLKEKEYQQAQQKGFPLQEIPIAIDAIAIVVNPQLNVQALTVQELRDIYLGKITNWEEVGGPDLPITPYSRTTASGTVGFFVENILENQPLGTNVESIKTTTLALQKVANNLGGIYFASAPEVVTQCGVKPLPIGIKSDQWVPPYQEPFVPLEDCPKKRNQLNQAAFLSGEYPITRRLFVIIKQNGQADQKAGEAYTKLLLTKQGQDLVEKAGYTRIRY